MQALKTVFVILAGIAGGFALYKKGVLVGQLDGEQYGHVCERDEVQDRLAILRRTDETIKAIPPTVWNRITAQVARVND